MYSYLEEFWNSDAVNLLFQFIAKEYFIRSTRLFSPVPLHVFVFEITTHHVVTDYGLDGTWIIHSRPTIMVCTAPQGNAGHTHIRIKRLPREQL